MDREPRLTYRSAFGDYGLDADDFDLETKFKMFSKLGRYEDIGTPAQFQFLVDRFLAEQQQAPAPLDLGAFSAGAEMEGWCK